MKILSKSIILVIITFLIFSGCKKDDLQLQKDFAKFDKSYIPALSLTNQGNKDASVRAMESLKQTWAELKGKYGQKNESWTKASGEVEHRINKADELINSDGNLAEAHESLEGVRMILLNMRKANNIEYYIDYTTEFHESMEEIVIAVQGKTPGTLTDDDIKKINEILPEALSRWNKLESAKFDNAIFELNGEKMESVNKYMKLEAEALNKLRQALDSGDKKAIIRSAMGIKPNFVKMFTSFGN